jgi:hypothetical protein
MKRPSKAAPDELRPEYDFSEMAGGVRGKHLRRYRAGTNLALLEHDIAQAFPTDEAVNKALRALLEAAASIPRARRSPKKPLKPKGTKPVRS